MSSMISFTFVQFLLLLTVAALTVSGNPTDHFKSHSNTTLAPLGIYNGKVVTSAEDYPFIVALRITKVNLITGIDEHFNCGGSIIGREAVLTAAHCLAGKVDASAAKLVQLMVGETNRAQGHYQYESTKYRIHPNYHSQENDLALVFVPGANFRPSQMVKLAQPPSEQAFDDQWVGGAGEECRVMGWGRTELTPERGSDQLRVASMSITECSVRSTETRMCVSNLEQGQATCKGDSGSPLVCRPLVAFSDSQAAWRQLGVDSFGQYGDCRADKWTMFTRVSAFVAWIRREVNY